MRRDAGVSVSTGSQKERQYVRTVTTGWRFTLPSQIREARGWDEGTVLRAQIAGESIILVDAGGQSDEMICYLGSGGKIVIPAEVREKTGWSLGERIAIRNGSQGVVLTPCCRRDRCRSCGNLYDVSEVIDNLFLCTQCWNRYVEMAVARRREAQG
jgi:bifunctional DNA-binding transcriptional regulator/antitoxin component of YhaV-PrlF toxin-antitoxin module